jgi:F-box and WD-40 domain protein CDC4
MDLDCLERSFEVMSSKYQTEVIRQLLRHCAKATLRLVRDITEPALKCDFLARLPPELSANVLGHLDAQSICRAAQVSRGWWHVVDSNDLAWKSLLARDGYVVPKVEAGPGLQLLLSQGGSERRNSSIMPRNKSIYRRHRLTRERWMDNAVQPHHRVLQAHGRHVITCLQLDSERIVTGGDDMKINVFSLGTGALLNVLYGHEATVTDLQCEGDVLVSASCDRTVRVWSLSSGRCLHVLRGHNLTVRCLFLGSASIGNSKFGAPEEPLIISGSRDSTIRVWKLPRSSEGGGLQDHSGQPCCVRVLSGHRGSVRTIAAHADTLVSGSYDHSVRVWRISSGEVIHELLGHTHRVYSVALDHKRNRCISGSRDKLVKVWCLASGSCIHTLEGHTSLVGLLELGRDRLVSASADSTLRIWDPETGDCKRVLHAPGGNVTCFQHDGQKLVSGSDGGLRVWDIQTGKRVRDLLADVIWHVKFDGQRCVAAVQRGRVSCVEVRKAL